MPTEKPAPSTLKYMRLSSLPAALWATRTGWFWADRSAPWLLGDDRSAHGPFKTAVAAGRNCRAVMVRKKAAAA